MNTNKKMNKYLQMLKQNNLKATAQRLFILEFLDKNRIHPTAEQIYKKILEKNPSFSKTTVYNTLYLFKKYNLLEILNIDNKELRFDINAKPHLHFICNKCGQIFDFFNINIKSIFKQIQKKKFKIEKPHLYIKGLCNKCRKRR